MDQFGKERRPSSRRRSRPDPFCASGHAARRGGALKQNRPWSTYESASNGGVSSAGRTEWHPAAATVESQAVHYPLRQQGRRLMTRRSKALGEGDVEARRNLERMPRWVKVSTGTCSRCARSPNQLGAAESDFHGSRRTKTFGSNILSTSTFGIRSAWSAGDSGPGQPWLRRGATPLPTTMIGVQCVEPGTSMGRGHSSEEFGKAVYAGHPGHEGIWSKKLKTPMSVNI